MFRPNNRLAIKTPIIGHRIPRLQADEIMSAVQLLDLDRLAVNGRPPRTVAVIKITEVYLHCAKAIMRSNLWDETAHADRSLLPSMGQMLKEHGALSEPAETEEETLARNKAELR
jgi:hypothetical protein